MRGQPGRGSRPRRSTASRLRPSRSTRTGRASLYAGAAYARRGASGVWGGRVFPPGTSPAGVSAPPTAVAPGVSCCVGRRPTRSATAAVSPASASIPCGRRSSTPPSSATASTALAIAGRGGRGSSPGGSAPTARPSGSSSTSPARARTGCTPTAAPMAPRMPAGCSSRPTHAAGRAVRRTSTDRRRPGSDAAGLCSGQCTYDLVVRVDPKRASVVFYVGGSAVLRRCLRVVDDAAVRVERPGRRTLTSQLAGDTDMTIDRGFDGLHPDMHAIEFADDRRTWFAGNDGGVWRIAPGFSDDSRSCRSFDPQRGRQLTGTAAQRCRATPEADPARRRVAERRPRHTPSPRDSASIARPPRCRRSSAAPRTTGRTSSRAAVGRRGSTAMADRRPSARATRPRCGTRTPARRSTSA